MKHLAFVIAASLLLGGALSAESKQKKAINKYKEAVKLGNDGKVKEAVAMFEESVKLYPDLYVSYVKLGVAYKMMGRIPEAFAWYDMGVKVKVHPEVTYNARGEFLYEYGLYELAIADFKAAIKKGKKTKKDKKYLADPYENLVKTLLKLKLSKDAKEYLDKGLKLLPDNAKLLFYRGYFMLQKDDTINAEKVFNKILKADPKSPIGLYGLGVVYVKAGNKDKAKEYLKKSCALKYRKACKELQRISIKKLH